MAPRTKSKTNASGNKRKVRDDFFEDEDEDADFLEEGKEVRKDDTDDEDAEEIEETAEEKRLRLGMFCILRCNVRFGALFYIFSFNEDALVYFKSTQIIASLIPPSTNILNQLFILRLQPRNTFSD